MVLKSLRSNCIGPGLILSEQGENICIEGSGRVMKQSMMAEASRKSRSESHAMLSANKCSHVISKSYSAAKDEGSSRKYSQHENMVTPKVPVVYIVYEPKIIKTDPESFPSVVQRLTGNTTHKSKEKKRQMHYKSPFSEVIPAEGGTENFGCTIQSNDQLPIMENQTSQFSPEDFCGLYEGFSDTDMVFPILLKEGLLDEIPLISPSLMNHGFSPASSSERLLDQLSTHKSKGKRRQTNYQTSEVIAAEVGSENDECTFNSNDQMLITENKTTKFSSEEVSQGLPDEIPLVWNNSPFCNMYDQTGFYKWTY